MNQKRVFAVGDIHGHPKTLKALLRKLDLAHGDTIVFLGDYLDRGPDSRGVISHLIKFKRQMIKKGVNTVFLAGNHCGIWLGMLKRFDMLNLWKDDPPFFVGNWRNMLIPDNGVLDALYQYGSRVTYSENVCRDASISPEGIDGLFTLTPPQVSKAHINFLESLVPYCLIPRVGNKGKNLLFVHADIHPDTLHMTDVYEVVRESIFKDSSSPEESHMLWERCCLDIEPGCGKDTLIVHGHTPISTVFSRYYTMLIIEGDPERRKSIEKFLDEIQFRYRNKQPVIVNARLNLDGGEVLTAAKFVDGELYQVFQQEVIDH